MPTSTLPEATILADLDKKSHDDRKRTEGDAQSELVGTIRSGRATEDSFIGSVKTWPYAIVWSLTFSSPMVLVAYGPAWIQQLFALPAFVIHFGEDFEGQPIIPAGWQTALSSIELVGLIIGSIFIAIPMETFGRKLCFAACLVLSAAFTFVQFFGKTLSTLLAGTLLQGICLGGFAVLSFTYAVEVAPFHLRGVLTAFVSLAIVLGSVIAIGIAAGVAARLDHWAYQVGFAIQWAWPAFILPVLFFAPESPTWLVRVGRFEEAEVALRKLSVKGFDVQTTLAEITDNDRLETEMDASTSYKECFAGTNLRRTLIAIGTYSTSVTTGIFPVGWSTYTLSLVGIEITAAFDMSVGISCASFLGALVGMVLIATFSRRKLWIYGLSIGAVLLLCVGFINLAPDYLANKSFAWVQAAFMLLWSFVYGAVINPVAYAIMSEVASTHLRAKTIGIASMIQFSLSLIITIVFPYLVNLAQGNLQGRTCFIFGGFEVMYATWAFFCVPETSQPIEDLDIKFDRKVKTRAFEKPVLL